MPSPILAIALLWALQCLGPTQIKTGIVGVDGVKPYNILILFFSLAYMAITLDITGVLQAAAFWVSNKGGSHGYKLYFYFYVLLTVLSIFLGNDPVILSGTAFLVYYTKVMELDPVSWLMSEFAAANTASMVLFVGNPTNVVICEGFAVNSAAFTAYTILPFLGCSVICLFALGVQFRKLKYIPRRLTVTEDLDVRSVLLDPIGACVGSALLGSCLILIIIVSFFHVDVWKISLPFAAAKFIYDLSWDHYRWAKNIPMLVPRPKRKRSDDMNSAVQQDIPSETTGTAGANRDVPKKITIKAAEKPDSTARTRSSALPSTLTESRTFVDEPNPLSPESIIGRLRSRYLAKHAKLAAHFPTFFTALPRLPFALVPFAFSQFILIEGLAHQGWIDVFSVWLVRASNRQMHPVIWLIGVLGVILCNCAGTNIGATILLTKIVRAAALGGPENRAAAIALAVASNIGAVSFTFSASLAGLLWRQILEQKGIFIRQRTFAYWNTRPLVVMTVVGLGIVSAEMAVLYR
ncbi:hypothetical protein DXG01_007560 [Tephrocybe rancida]|nr:hypothetical protein DXG01_007560 [Tephrocybe rancida]